MKFRVNVTANAEAEIAETYHWIAEQSPSEALHWIDRLEARIRELESFPRRGRIAAEGSLFAQEVRQITLGDYRIMYLVTEHTVDVLHVRHSARREPRE